MRLVLFLITFCSLAACSGGSKSPTDVPEAFLKDVFPVSGEALQWSLKATNETELKSYFEKALAYADKIQMIPPFCQPLACLLLLQMDFQAQLHQSCLLKPRFRKRG